MMSDDTDTSDATLIVIGAKGRSQQSAESLVATCWMIHFALQVCCPVCDTISYHLLFA